jgi:hypothetical protein
MLCHLLPAAAGAAAAAAAGGWLMAKVRLLAVPQWLNLMLVLRSGSGRAGGGVSSSGGAAASAHQCSACRSSLATTHSVIALLCRLTQSLSSPMLCCSKNEAVDYSQCRHAQLRSCLPGHACMHSSLCMSGQRAHAAVFIIGSVRHQYRSSGTAPIPPRTSCRPPPSG